MCSCKTDRRLSGEAMSNLRQTAKNVCKGDEFSFSRKKWNSFSPPPPFFFSRHVYWFSGNPSTSSTVMLSTTFGGKKKMWNVRSDIFCGNCLLSSSPFLAWGEEENFPYGRRKYGHSFISYPRAFLLNQRDEHNIIFFKTAVFFWGGAGMSPVDTSPPNNCFSIGEEPRLFLPSTVPREKKEEKVCGGRGGECGDGPELGGEGGSRPMPLQKKKKGSLTHLKRRRRTRARHVGSGEKI